MVYIVISPRKIFAVQETNIHPRQKSLTFYDAFISLLTDRRSGLKIFFADLNKPVTLIARQIVN